jgi:cytochrome bd-type quinol oxidase subunit 2
MIGIAAFLFVLAAPFFIYKNAKQNGHNAILWTIISIVAGVGVQFFIPLMIGMTIGIYWALKGYSEDEITAAVKGPATIIGIISLIASIVGVLAIMKKVNTIPEEAFLTVQPPPPPTFE